MAVVYISYHDIDKQKWDACINNASNGLIYACSFYLDAMAENWDALVMNDYEAVMPLTWKKKYGIYYLYQPPFTASLGLFGNNITAKLLNDFLNNIPVKFRYWDIYLNCNNLFALDKFTLYQRMNLVLSLAKNDEQLHQNFKDNIKRNAKRALQLNCLVKKNIDVAKVIALAKEQVQVFSTISDRTFIQFANLYNHLVERKLAATYGVYSPTGQLLASAVFFFFKNRVYYILVGNHPNSKAFGASHLLISSFIKDYAATNLLLDFEGSDIKSLAFFYKGFGATEEIYAGLKNNKLPRLLRYFKK